VGKIVGIFGVGQLGLPISINLMRSGYHVVGVNRPDAEAFVREGGELLDTPADVADAADYVLLCLPNEEAEIDVVRGAKGALKGLGPGKVVIELGTYRREFKQAQARYIEECGAEVLEAEVSGSPIMVAERRAALYVGGSEALMERCKPLLEAITAHYFHIGEFGSAVTMKLIANYLITIHTLAAAEAINLGARAGFDPKRVAQVIGQGAGSSTMFSIRAPMMAARTFSPAPGPFKTLEKYLQMGGALAKELDCATPLFSTAMPYFVRAIEIGMGDEDISAVIKLIESESGNGHSK